MRKKLGSSVSDFNH